LRIRIQPHTPVQGARRGVSVDVIEDVVRTGGTTPAKHGRLEKTKTFNFDWLWCGGLYALYVRWGGRQ
jgi:hypothetical protein